MLTYGNTLKIIPAYNISHQLLAALLRVSGDLMPDPELPRTGCSLIYPDE
jgi:hypothetical protein